jgi:hypothetical protein
MTRTQAGGQGMRVTVQITREQLLAQIRAAKRSFAKWPKWMRDNAYFACAAPPRRKP